MCEIIEEMKDIVILSGSELDEKMKDKAYRKTVVDRWRAIGVLDGVKPNSVVEKRISESFERMACYLLSKERADFGGVSVTIFPIIRIVLTTVGANGHLTRVVFPDEIFRILETSTLAEMETVLKSVVPKSRYENTVKLVCRFLGWKGYYDKSLFELLKDIYDIASPSECEMLAALAGSRGRMSIDAEISVMVSAFLVCKLK